MVFQKLFRRQHLSQQTEEFNRCLKLSDLTLLSITSSIGSGIYVLTGIASKSYAGQYVPLSYLLAALPCIFSGLCFAEFSARVNSTGGAYSFVYHSLGELFAFLVGWSMLLAGLASLAVTSLAWSTYLDSLLDHKLNSTVNPHWNLSEPFSNHLDVPALCLITLLFIIASIGVEFIAFFNNILATLNVTLLSFIIIMAFSFGDWSNITNVPYTNGVNGILHGTTLVLYSYLGFEGSAAAIAEAENPRKNVPLSMIISLSTICVLYSLTSLSLNLMVPYNLIDESAPFASAFKPIGTGVHLVLSIGPLISLTGTLLSTIYGLGRFIYAMSNDGLLFKFLSIIHPRFKIPLYANAVSYILIVILITAFDIKDLIGFTDIIGFLQYGIVACGILVLRYYKPHKRPNLTASNDDPSEDDDEAIEMDTAQNPLLDTEVDQTQHVLARTPSKKFYERTQTYRPYFSLLLIVALIACNILLSILFFKFKFKIICTIFLLAINSIVCLILTFLCKQNQDTNSIGFKVPFVPLVPILSVTLNIFFVISSDVKDWIGFAIVLCLALPLYLFYSFKHSRLHK